MMRRIPYTLLVCLAFFMSTVLATAPWAAETDDLSVQKLNKPELNAHSFTKDAKPKAIVKVKPKTMFPCCAYQFPCPEIAKVKPNYMATYGTEAYLGESVLSTAPLKRWEVSGGVIFASLRGKIAWPRYASASFYAGYGSGSNAADFTDGLQLPGHLAVPTWSLKLLIPPELGVPVPGLAFKANGGGQPTGNFIFGPSQQNYGSFGYGTGIQTQYQHSYHRIGLLYEPVKNYRSSVAVFVDWVHAEDKITVISSITVGQNSVFSKGTDAVITGLEFQRLMKTTSNGAELSCDCKVGGIFLDDVEGWDAQAGAKYTYTSELRPLRICEGRIQTCAVDKGSERFSAQGLSRWRFP